jgi:anti-sigma B factor antagonist
VEDAMEIQTRNENDVVIVGVEGRLDAVSSPELEAQLTRRVANGEILLVLDLARLEYISSAGLRVILSLTKSVKGKQGKLVLASLQNAVREVFDISGFSAILPLCADVNAALAQIRSV